MDDTRFISGEAALRNFMEGLRSDIDDRLAYQNINASGALMNSNLTEVSVGVGSATGRLYALDYWKNAGNGVPPGTRVEIGALAKWARDKGLAVSPKKALRIAMLVRRKIMDEGSKQYREHGTNVYTDAITEAQPRVEGVLRAFLSDWPKAINEQFGRAFKAA